MEFKRPTCLFVIGGFREINGGVAMGGMTQRGKRNNLMRNRKQSDSWYQNPSYKAFVNGEREMARRRRQIERGQLVCSS